jgi:hypothetical protein
MKLGFVLLSVMCLHSGHSVYAKCLAIPVQVQGQIDGEVQQGDTLVLQFVYSPKRIATSSAQTIEGQDFTVLGAYSTYRKRGLLGDVCTAAPHRIQLLMKNRNSETLATVELIAADERTDHVTELAYGKKQLVVLRPERERQ